MKKRGLSVSRMNVAVLWLNNVFKRQHRGCNCSSTLVDRIAPSNIRFEIKMRGILNTDNDQLGLAYEVCDRKSVIHVSMMTESVALPVSPSGCSLPYSDGILISVHERLCSFYEDCMPSFFLLL